MGGNLHFQSFPLGQEKVAGGTQALAILTGSQWRGQPTGWREPQGCTSEAGEEEGSEN